MESPFSSSRLMLQPEIVDLALSCIFGAARGIEPPTARSVAWCSASIWMVPDGSGLLTLDASSVQTAPDGSRRIVWMIKRMIKPCDAAPSVTQTTAGTVERSPDIPSGDAWRTGGRTVVAPSSEQRITRQQRIVHRVLLSAVLAAQVGGVVQPVRSSGAE
jgi:hypothetical protein